MNYKIALALLVIPIGVTSLMMKSVSAAEVNSTFKTSQSPMLVAQRYDDRREELRREQLRREELQREAAQRNQVRRDVPRRVWVAGHYEPGFLGIGRKWVEGHWEERR